MAYKSGSWKVHCAVCGCVVRREQARKRWDGVIVCRRDWEPKHPQLNRTPRVREGRPVPDARPEPADQYTDVSQNWEDCSLYWHIICDNWETMDDNIVNVDPGFDGTFNTDDTL